MRLIKSWHNTKLSHVIVSFFGALRVTPILANLGFLSVNFFLNKWQNVFSGVPEVVCGECPVQRVWLCLVFSPHKCIPIQNPMSTRRQRHSTWDSTTYITTCHNYTKNSLIIFNPLCQMSVGCVTTWRLILANWRNVMRNATCHAGEVLFESVIILSILRWWLYWRGYIVEALV